MSTQLEDDLNLLYDRSPDVLCVSSRPSDHVPCVAGARYVVIFRDSVHDITFTKTPCPV